MGLMQDRIAKQITDSLTEKLAKEFIKISQEFKLMGQYINKLEERIEKLETKEKRV